jgi:hypothetical protein
MAIDRKHRQHQASASAVVIANNSDKKKSSSHHSRNSQRNDDSESSALSAAGALLELGATAGGDSSENNKVHKAKKTDATLRHPFRRYRRNANNVRALNRPILPSHPTEISDDEADDVDENCSTYQRSASIRVPRAIEVHFHNYNAGHQRSSSSIPGDIGNINVSVASPGVGWIGTPLGPPPRLPFGSRNRNRLMCNLGPIPNGSPIHSSSSKKSPTMNGIHISH